MGICRGAMSVTPGYSSVSGKQMYSQIHLVIPSGCVARETHDSSEIEAPRGNNCNGNDCLWHAEKTRGPQRVNHSVLISDLPFLRILQLKGCRYTRAFEVVAVAAGPSFKAGVKLAEWLIPGDVQFN